MSLLASSTQAQTTVWIVRHAEPNFKHTVDADMPLSLDGQDRAKDLATLLMPQRLLGVYATSLKRSKQTAEPAAYGHGLTVQTYDPTDLETFAASVLRKHKGGSVVVVGDSKSVLELIEAFGMKRPVPLIAESEYDYIFTVTINGNSMGLQTSQYGKLRKSVAPK